MTHLSIVIPTLNEAHNLSVLLDDLTGLKKAHAPFEVIVVDGGSHDGTRASAEQHGATLISGEQCRGAQLHAGYLASCGDLIWLLHADSRVDAEAVDVLQSLTNPCVWGWFDLAIGDTSASCGLRLIASTTNLRARLTCIATGDQGIFASRALLREIGGVPNQPLMEDIELSLRLRQAAPPTLVKPRIQTSARRWREKGLLRVTWQNTRLRSAYALGASSEALARRYYSVSDNAHG